MSTCERNNKSLSIKKVSLRAILTFLRREKKNFIKERFRNQPITIHHLLTLDPSKVVLRDRYLILDYTRASAKTEANSKFYKRWWKYCNI